MSDAPPGRDASGRDARPRGVKVAQRLRILLAASALCSLAAFGWSRLFGLPALLLSLPALRYARLPEGRFLWRITLGGFGFALLAFLSSVTAVLAWQPYWIPSGSMTPALQVGDRILVDENYYLLHAPRVGDIVAYQPPEPVYDPEKPIFVKRIVGLPGEALSLLEGRLYRDGEPVEREPIASLRYSDTLAEATGEIPVAARMEVPSGQVYVFGDNSARSYDSRYWGGVPIENLRGKVIYRFWPLSRIGRVP